jgi:heme exporter protein D
MTNKEDDKDLKIKELEFEYRWMSMSLAVLSLLALHLSSSDRIKDLEQKVTQERFRKEIPNSQ